MIPLTRSLPNGVHASRPPAHERPFALPKVEARPHPANATTATYEADESEYMAAVQQFKARTGQLFPTCSDYLAIAKSLGYRRPAPAIITANEQKGL